MKEAMIENLKKKLMDDVDMPYVMLNDAFALFNKKWLEAQKSSPLDRKNMDELITEALDESIPDKAESAPAGAIPPSREKK
ncbi:hypothetical protein KJ633_03465 [bacterium]|nr:hypothetical protein [bacterium]MBU3955496.1 hypothetical protein [bacterium]